MDLLEILQQISAQTNSALQPTDLAIGTVTKISPLEITTDVHQAALRREVLLLTEAVVEKKITTLAHSHDTMHNHSVTEGSISPAGECSTELGGVICYENGVPLPNSAGYVTLNRGLALGDKVLLLSVQHGQKYIVLSHLF